jgi:hypothetical protein
MTDISSDFKRVSSEWKTFGFQREDPVSDIRGGGVVGVGLQMMEVQCIFRGDEFPLCFFSSLRSCRSKTCCGSLRMTVLESRCLRLGEKGLEARVILGLLQVGLDSQAAPEGVHFLPRSGVGKLLKCFSVASSVCVRLL